MQHLLCSMLGGVPIYDILEVSFLSVSVTVLRVGLNILTAHSISHPLLNHLDPWLPLPHLAPPPTLFPLAAWLVLAHVSMQVLCWSQAESFPSFLGKEKRVPGPDLRSDVRGVLGPDVTEMSCEGGHTWALGGFPGGWRAWTDQEAPQHHVQVQ